MEKYKFKKDRFRKSRDGPTQLYEIYCSTCEENVFIYQKDGHGGLLRFYLDRILGPPEKVNQFDRDFKSVKSIDDLACGSCEEVLAVPMVYQRESRYAFRIIPGRISKKRVYQ